MQNSLSKFHHLSFQSSKFTFCHFSPLSFNHSQFSIQSSVNIPSMTTVNLSKNDVVFPSIYIKFKTYIYKVEGKKKKKL